MNDILELIAIISELGGEATTDQILKAYCSKHHMISQRQYRAPIMVTLKENSGRVKYNPDSDFWYLANKKKTSSNILTTLTGENLEGSPEWFFEYSQNDDIQERMLYIQDLREKFIDKFSPEKLEAMSGHELLTTVFADKDSMLYLLTMDDTYRQFGAGSKFPYLWPLRYFVGTGECLTYSKSKAVSVEPGEEETTAEKIRDQLVHCIKMIEEIGSFDSLADYEVLDKKLDSVSFGKFPWTLKYYQMLFPQYFPAMYADPTINRTLNILGLQKHSNKRLLNMAEVSLYIRRCNVDCITFGHIYGTYFTWDEDRGPCEYARSRSEL